jgi:hypothetical protein
MNDESLLIGRLATLCGLSASALRCYDECGLLNPSRLDPQSGDRHYDLAQVDEARLIRDLRAAGWLLPIFAGSSALTRRNGGGYCGSDKRRSNRTPPRPASTCFG